MFRKNWKKVVAFVMAAAMMIPAIGISANAEIIITDEAINLKGKSIYAYTSQSGADEVENMVDGNDDTFATLNRGKGNYAAYVVYNGSDFGNQVDKIRFYSSEGQNARSSITISGTDNDAILNGANFVDEAAYNSFRSTHCNQLWATSGAPEVTKEIEDEKKDFSKYTYIVVFSDSWQHTRVNELTFYKTTTTSKSDLNRILYVDDVTFNRQNDSRVGNSDAEYEITADVDVFALTDGSNITLTKANGIDRNSGNPWDGNLQATVNVEKAGNYLVSILGQTDLNNGRQRSFQIKVNDGKEIYTNAGDTIVGSDGLSYYSAVTELTEGDNTLTVTGGATGAAPNFIALAVTEVAQPKVTWITDTDSAVVEGKGTIRFLAQYTTDATVESAAFALVKNDGTIEFAFSPATATAFYADVTDIPEAAFGKTCTAVPYVTIGGEAVVGDFISASVNVAE